MMSSNRAVWLLAVLGSICLAAGRIADGIATQNHDSSFRELHQTPETSSGPNATVNGTLSVLHMHVNGSSDTTYLLMTETIGVKVLIFAAPRIGSFSTGDKVNIVYDSVAANTAATNNLVVLGMRRIMGTGRLQGGSAAKTITSITFLLAPCGTKAAMTPNELKQVYFNENAKGSYNTLQNFFGSCSLGATSFTSGSNIIVGPIPLPCSGSNEGGRWSAQRCEVYPDVYGWAYAAEDYATSKLGIDLQQYKHRIMVLPENSPCLWAGLGSVGCGDSCYVWVKGPNAHSPNAYAHELGHNLFLDHAGQDSDEYGDPTSAMGYCCSDRCYNAPQLYQLGWATPVVQLNAATLTTRQTYTIYGRTTRSQNFIRVLPTWKSATMAPLYISLIAPAGLDQYLDPSYRGKVAVNTWPGNARSQQSIRTNLKSILNEGTTWLDQASGLWVRVDNIADNGRSATITVCAMRQPGKELSCSDGIDNDCDGFVDAADPNCKSQNGGNIEYDGGNNAKPPTARKASPSPRPRSPPRGKPTATCNRNKVCEPLRGENAAACPFDCPAKCGDGYCDTKRAETVRTCSHDCPGICGDRYCDKARGEGPVTCAKDCPSRCGDGFCHAQKGETAKTCPKDCPRKCGDKFCDTSRGESYDNCRADCPSQIFWSWGATKARTNV